MTDRTDPGRLFRDAWIEGVTRHYPGTPKPGYITPWQETPDWEKSAAAAVEAQVRHFIDVAAGATSKLSSEQRGRFVALCWIAQIHRAVEDPKPSYTADWENLPEWQKATDIHIFETIEKATQG